MENASCVVWAREYFEDFVATYDGGGAAAEIPKWELVHDESISNPESYRIDYQGDGLVIHVADGRGAKMALLDWVDALKTGSSFGANLGEVKSPHFEFRAIKFNLPWDAYRSNDAITLHFDQCRELAFWEAWLDMMAENRFNVLTLWNLHPWPYLIRPTDYPYASGFSESEQLEWRQLFQGIFRLAKERGIETYLVNWNIFVSEAFARHHGLKGRANISIERGYSTEIAELAKQYNRDCVTQVLDEYPDLTGIGVSLGEAMGGMTAEVREQWVQDVFVSGIQRANRPAKFIHRLPFSAGLSNGGTTSKSTEILTRDAIEETRGMLGPIYTEAKFNWSHGHSTSKLVKVHGGKLQDTYWNPEPENYKMCWMVRNEDFFTLRWGNSEFIREHILKNGGLHVGGYYVGSECYIPAVDYFTRNIENRDWSYAFERQWLFYSMWGRLLYQPDQDDAVFKAQYRERYGEKGDQLFNAMQLASQFPLKFASFIDLNNDKSFYSEGFLARDRADASRFLDLDLMLRKATLDPDYISIEEWVSMVKSEQDLNPGQVSPLMLAESLDELATDALSLTEGVDPGSSEAMRQELTDIRAWSHLSFYLADKIRAGIELQRYRYRRWNGTGEEKSSARRHLLDAIVHWEDLIDVTEPVYRIVPLTHLHRQSNNLFHWSLLRDDVRSDLEIIDSDQY